MPPANLTDPSFSSLLDSLAHRFPLVTSEVTVGARQWRITAVQNQDALLDAADTVEHFPYGFLLWEAAVGLARFLAENPALVAGKQVLELGAGVGLPGLVARSLGAEMCQTDHQRGALLLCQANAMQNDVVAPQVCLADWRTWPIKAKVDVLLGADILYERAMHFYLERIFRENLAPGGCLLLSDPDRPQARDFIAYLETTGWRFQLETCSVLLEQEGQETRPVPVALYIGTRE